MIHTVPVERAAFISHDPRGLTAAEASECRGRYGLNDIVMTPPSGWRNLLRSTVRDPMIWFLAATALLFAWLGDYVEAGVLAIALVPIIGMDAYLHRRTQASTEGLAGRLAVQARVVRDGVLVDIPSSEVVPGDVAVIRDSEPFPADGVLIGADDVQVDESALTGEALPVRKRAIELGSKHQAGKALGELAIENESWGSAGTRVLTGEARLRVVFTGAQTLYGQIVRSAQADEHERTPLQQALTSLVSILLVAAILMCLALAVIRYLQGHGVVDALLSAVILAVAALPEEFPVVFALFLSIGVYRLAQRQALVRRAVVVENIGRVTCICSDKTGTLTEGRLQLTHLMPGPGVSEGELLRVAAIASRESSADPMDLAIQERAAAVMQSPVAVFPFTEDRRREVAIVQDEGGVLIAAAKGAPETLLDMSAISAVERERWLSATLEFASSGHKVIACARCELASWQGGEPERNYVLLGLLAFEDPVRPSANEAVKKARAAGIRVIMVTGDHPATAQAIAAEVGIGESPPRVIDGPDLHKYLNNGDAGRLSGVDVVARCIPAQKLELVRALRAAGEIVAVTGDGVNDVPALQGADIGIAMGERGTRSAREVASIVLLDDNFRTIIAAISEGRQLFENLRLSFAYLLMVHIPLVLTAAVIPFAGYPLLYLPAHIVWLELIIHPTAMLVFPRAPASGSLGPMRRGGRVRFFDAVEWTIICAVGVIVTVVIALAYVRGLGADSDVEHARSMAMVMLITASTTITVGLGGLKTRTSAMMVATALASAVVLVQVPPLAALLHLSPLHVDDWLLAGATGLVAGALAFLIVWRRRVRKLLPDTSADKRH